MIKIQKNKFVLILVSQIIMAQPALSVQSSAETILKIKIQPFSQVEHKKIKLEDIAKITGKDPDLVKKAKSTVLASAPIMDRSVFLSENLVRKALFKKGFDLNKLNLLFPEIITVKNKLIRISEQEAKETIRNYLYENMPWQKDQVTITQINLLGDILLPGGNVEQRVTLKGNNSFIGIVPIYLEFIVDGKVLKRKKVNVRLEVLIPVVLTRASMKRNQIISEDDIFIEKRLVSKASKKIFTSKDEVIGKRLKRHVKAGKLLFESLLETPADITKGNRVTIIAESKSIKITAPGIARQDGRKGQVIKIKNLNSKKVIYARVISATTVKVDF